MKKVVAIYLLPLLLYSYSALSANVQTSDPEFLLFIGERGSGKSAIIEALIGARITPAHHIEVSYEGKYYLQSEGLAEQSREYIARGIEAALKQNGKYRIFFVVPLQSSRVRLDGVTTINMVMDAITIADAKFNVIINMLDGSLKEALLKDPFHRAIRAQINSGKHKTDSFWYTEYFDLDTDYVTPFRETGLHDFVLHNSNAISITKDDVGTIEIDEFEKIESWLRYSCYDIQKGQERYEALVSQLEESQKLSKATTEALTRAQKDAEDKQELIDKMKSAQAREEAYFESTTVGLSACAFF